MSDEDIRETGGVDAPSDEGEQKAGFNAKKLILFIVLPLLLLGGIGGGLYFSGLLDPYLGGAQEEAAEGEEGQATASDNASAKTDAQGGKAASASATFIAIPTMIVNLSEEDGTPRFLRLTVQLELKNPADSAKVEAVMPRVIDQFQTYLRELRVQDLRGSAGIYRLQMELLWRVNQAASPVEVKDVLFQEILIQ